MPLPDDGWIGRVNGRLKGNRDWAKAIGDIGDPLFLKVKTDDEASAILLRLGDGAAQPALAKHPGDHVDDADAIVVSTKVETWDRLLNGSQDLMSAFLGRDVKAKASMMKLMKIANPAEKLLQLVGEAQRGA